MSPTMLDYINQTPEVLRANLADRARVTHDLVALLRERRPRRLRFVASGSSYHGCLAALALMNELLDAEVSVVTPHAFSYYHGGLAPDDLVVVVSQSGLSTNAIAALDAVAELGGTTVGLTASPEAEIASHCDHVIDYHAGEELVPYVTKGLSALCLYLMVAAVEYSGNTTLLSGIDRAIELGVQVRDRTHDFVRRRFRDLTAISTVYFCTSGPTHAVGLEAALKTGETVHVPAFCYEVEEYIHGPNLQLDPNYTVFFLDANDASSQRTAQIYRATRAVTERAYILTADPAFADDPNAVVLGERPDPDVMSLAYLPYLQVICHEVSMALRSTRQHPLMAEFSRIAASKTADIFVHDPSS